MEYLHIFPHLNASLNTLSAILLLTGYTFIRQGKIRQHQICMISAVTVSALFLVSYLTHHTIRTYLFGLGPTKFTGEGFSRIVYFTVLGTHTVLAAVIAPFIIWVLRRALKGKFELHKKLARYVFPVWLYVSVTGIIVYLMLYQLYPSR